MKNKILESLINVKNIHELINDHCFAYRDLCALINVEYCSKNINIIRNYLKHLDIKILYPNIPCRRSRLINRYSIEINNWFNHEILSECILFKLKNNLVLNFSESKPRYVISVKDHHRSSKANQVKAHIILWEYYNKQLFPDNHVLVPKDGNFCNLNINNFDIYENHEYRSIVSSGNRNHFHTTGLSTGTCYKGGWKTIAKKFKKNKNCSICGEQNKYKLNVHHIISYHLFNKPKDAHFVDNLICLCDSCHQKVHLHKINLSGYVSERIRLNLIELLEQLMKNEINKDLKYLIDFSIKSISSQASLEEGSTTILKGSTLQANGNGSSEHLTV